MDRWLQRIRHGRNFVLSGFLFLLISLLGSNIALAMPAFPGAVFDTQPDGSYIELRIKGDEHFNWYEDANGFTVVQQNGWYQYAQLGSSGSLESTGLNVGRADPAAAGLTQRILPSAGIQALSRLEIDTSGSSPQAVPPFGTVKNLVVLLRFSDHVGRPVPSEADVDVLMNSPVPVAGIAPTGSVKAVYLENSYGQMTLESTVALWVTVPNTEAFYAAGNSGLGTNLHPALRAALDGVDAQPGINFDDFDTDNDNNIDSITFLHSGYAAEFGGTDSSGAGVNDRIWSHRWTLLASGPAWTSSTGVRVTDFHISPSLWGTSGNGIGRIGVISHETGHFFGLPDLYDTSGSGDGIGSWGLMANSWDFNFTQLCPPHFSPWSKINLGWYSPTVIQGPGQYAINQAETNAEVYRVEQNYPSNEYLLIENRQNAGFDCTIPQGGLIIWHIDDQAGYNTEGYPGQTGWPSNGNHYRVAVLQADGNYDLEKSNNRGDEFDAHHGAGVDAMGTGPGGHPNTDAYQNGNIIVTGHEITAISASSASMTFCLNGCAGVVAPSALTATATNSTSITLNWSDNSLDEDGFTIQRSTDGSNFSNLVGVGPNVTSHPDTGLTPGTTYWYQVQAFTATETSIFSNIASDTTDDVPPASPSGLVATANGENNIDLIWVDNSNNEDGFRVERSTSSGSGFVQIGTVSAGTTAYADAGLSSSTTYYYRVYAFNAFDSAGFAAGDARTDDPPPIVEFRAFADQFGSGLVSGNYTDTHFDDGSVQWIEEKVSGGKKRDRTTYMGHFWKFDISSGDDIRVFANAYSTSSSDGDTFDFAWSATDSNYQPLFNVSEQNTDNMELGTIPNSVSGPVWIRVIDTDRTPGNSSDRDRIYVDELYIEVENFGPPTIPADPSGLSVTGVDFTEISIAWTDNSNNEDNFRVERSNDGSTGWAEIATVATNSTSYTDTGLPNGVTRHYRVRAWNGVGFSGYTNTDSGTTFEPETPPADPTIVSAVANGSSSITVNWIDNSNNEIGFRIRRSLDDISFSIIAAIGSATSFEDTSVAADTTYYYQVQAYNSVDSNWTTSVSATTDPGPTTIDLTASGFKNKGKKNFTLSWTPADGGSVNVILDSSIATSTADDGSFTLSTNLKGGGSHTLQVCETDGDFICSDIETVIF